MVTDKRKKYEIKDATGKVIGAGIGDPDWIARQMQDWRRRGVVEGDLEVSRERPDWLRVIDGKPEDGE